MCAIARKKKKIGLYINDVNAPFNGRKIIFREQGKVVGVEKKRELTSRDCNKQSMCKLNYELYFSLTLWYRDKTMQCQSIWRQTLWKHYWQGPD